MRMFDFRYKPKCPTVPTYNGYKKVRAKPRLYAGDVRIRYQFADPDGNMSRIIFGRKDLMAFIKEKNLSQSHMYGLRTDATIIHSDGWKLYRRNTDMIYLHDTLI